MVVKKQLSSLSIGLLCLTAVAACSKDEPTRGPTPILSGGSGGSAGRAGSSGASAGSGGSAGSGFTPPPAVPCGSAQCRQTGQPLMGFVLQEACCADAAANQCGWKAPGASACVKPPPVVAACPGLGATQPGCCIKDIDRCGIDGSMYGADCYNLVGSPFAASMPDLVARTCDGKPVDDDLDGGLAPDDDADGGELEPPATAGSGGAGGNGGSGGSAGAASSAGSGGSAGRGTAGRSGGAAGRGLPGRGGAGGRGLPGRGGN